MPFGYNVRANGVRLHLLRYAGEGPQMLIVPGITSPAPTWGFIAERLAERFDVHILDVRGRGLSEGGSLDYSLNAMADDTLAVIPAAGLKNPVLLGHSMGGRVIIRAAARDSSQMRQLVIADPPVSGPGRRVYPAQWSWYEDSITMAINGCSGQDMRKFCPTWSDTQNATRAEWLHTCHLPAIRKAFDDFSVDDIHADIGRIKLPMRLIVAGGAPVIEPEDVAEIKDLAPHLEVRTVRDAGHMIPWDDLEGFLAAIMDIETDQHENTE